MTNSPMRFKIIRDSDVQIVVSAVGEHAGKLGMKSSAKAALCTAISELLTNIVKYAKNGRLTLREVKRRGEPGLEVIVQDGGPGIPNLDEAMKENMSTGGSLGLGLPGTRRLVDEFEIDTEIGKGTKVRIVKWG